MRHSEVLVVTKSTTTPSIINWKVSTTNNVDTAIEKLQQHPYKVVAISNTYPEAEKLKLRQILTVLENQAIILEFKEESNLELEVKTAYFANKKLNFRSNYLDNSFKIKLANRLMKN